ncbi:Retrotransposable element Tf2 protein type 1 [Gossypium australe]|uniref:Retrotransposable element Tf2 protein type 1 n=1 Tax=Gossypium australe TaxID=47621 RepID=A0A5B6WHE6_9ROSI|nr:Retrotransposable element Tf2 protein type 1 [Gossypium australe]
MAPFEALYSRRCRTPLCWSDMEAKKSLGPELVWEIKDKARLKSYADLIRRDIKYQVDDKVFLKVSSWKKVLRFGQKGKLIPSLIDPYKVAKRIGLVAYHLLLPPELDHIHNVFHVSMLRKYRSDLSHVVPIEEIKIRSDLSYKEKPVAILDHEVKVLRNKTVLLVKKVLRFGHKGKLSLRFIRQYEIIERIRPIAYGLSLPPELEKIHNVFHVSMLRRYRSDPSHVITPSEIEIRIDMTYKEDSISYEVKELRNKKIPLMKVLWYRHGIEEAMLEAEDLMR